MSDLDLNLLVDTFEMYHSAAKRAEEKGDFFLAKRNYLLAAETMMKMAKLSSPQLKQARVQRAKRLIELANCLEVNGMPIKKAPPSNNNTPSGSNANASKDNEDGGKEWKAAKIPDISFDDIAGLDYVKETITIRMINPIKYPDAYKLYGKKTGGGVLLYGPPGTGKTMIAKAIAHEVGAVFYAIKASDIVSKWVGESEQNINALFEAASKQPLAIIFIDEMDNLFGTRGNDIHNDQRVNEFLQQIDGFAGKNPNLLLLGATNRPWAIDSAAVRSGRFSEKIYVPLPDYDARKYLFKIGLKGIDVLAGIDFDVLAEKSLGYSGADISEIVDLAKIEPLNEFIRTGVRVDITMADFERAFSKVKPSVDAREIANFEKFAGVSNVPDKKGADGKPIVKPEVTTEVPALKPTESTENVKPVEEVKPVVETKVEPTENVNPTVPPQDNAKVTVNFAEKVITLSNVKPKLEFKLSKDFESIYVKVGGKNYLCANRLGIWVSEELEIEESGNYHVQIFGDKLVAEDDITFTKGIIENDLF